MTKRIRSSIHDINNGCLTANDSSKLKTTNQKKTNSAFNGIRIESFIADLFVNQTEASEKMELNRISFIAIVVLTINIANGKSTAINSKCGSGNILKLYFVNKLSFCSVRDKMLSMLHANGYTKRC